MGTRDQGDRSAGRLTASPLKGAAIRPGMVPVRMHKQGHAINTSDKNNMIWLQMRLQRWTGSKWEFFGDSPEPVAGKSDATASGDGIEKVALGSIGKCAMMH